MGSDEGMVERVKDKARTALGGLLGKDDAVADEHPDIEYEPAPKQEILEDGMVVLSEQQSEQAEQPQQSGADGGGSAGSGEDTSTADR